MYGRKGRGGRTERTGFERSSTSEASDGFDGKFHETSDSGCDDGDSTSVISGDCRANQNTSQRSPINRQRDSTHEEKMLSLPR